MCGLIGMAGFLEHKHKLAMKDLLFLNSLRGKDSTGLTAIKRDRTVQTRKMTIPGYEFIDHPLVEKTFSHADQAWIGHGRYKTMGDVSRANAHPFEVLDENDDVYLVGTHNGTLQNKYELERKVGKFDTDSEALFNLFATAPNYKEAVKQLQGAWSLVWWDPTMDSIHFLRNEERPLTYAYTKDYKVIVWASEAWMIINACRRNGVELATNDKGLSCYSTNTDTLYTVEIPQGRNEPLPDMKREGGYVGQPTRNFQRSGWNDWWKDSNNPNNKGSEKKGTEGKKETTAVGKPKEKTVIELNPEHRHQKALGGIRGYGGEIISLEKLDEIKSKGCGWCSEPNFQAGIWAFLDEETMVCSRCMRDSHPRSGGEKEDYLNDDPFPSEAEPPAVYAENTEEYKRLMAAAAAKSVG